jgi:hypothetical protein
MCSVAWNRADYEPQQEASRLPEFREQLTGKAHEGEPVAHTSDIGV